MILRRMAIGVGGLALLSALLFLALPYIYLYMENRNFAALQERSVLNCETMPLHCIVDTGSAEVIARYIQSGQTLEAQDNWGQTALLWAIWYGKDDAVRQLLKAGANPNTLDQRGVSALLQFMRGGKFELAALWLDSGGDIDLLIEETDSQTVLHNCVMYNETACVRFLLENGADFTIEDNYGYSVLKRVQVHTHINAEITRMIKLKR